jgi:hypothetical protein
MSSCLCSLSLPIFLLFFPQDHLQWHDAMMATIPPGVLTSNLCDNSCELPALLMLGQEQQLAAVQLSHYVYKLLSIISQQMTSIHRYVAHEWWWW